MEVSSEMTIYYIAAPAAIFVVWNNLVFASPDRGMEELEAPGHEELEVQHPETLIWKRIRRSIVTRNGSEDEQDGDMRG